MSECGFVTDPAVEKRCGLYAKWQVFYRVGTGHIFVENPFLRCTHHLGVTVERLGEGYPWYLDHVEQVPITVSARVLA